MIKLVLIAIIISLSLFLIGAIRSKNFFEKLAFSLAFSNNMIIIILIYSLYEINNSFIDIAIIYVLLSFATVVTILKKYRDKNF